MAFLPTGFALILFMFSLLDERALEPDLVTRFREPFPLSWLYSNFLYVENWEPAVARYKSSSFEVKWSPTVDNLTGVLPTKLADFLKFLVIYEDRGRSLWTIG